MLFSGVVDVDPTLFWIGGAVVLFTCTSRAVGGLSLVGLARVPAVTASAGVGAVVTALALPAFAARLGAIGAIAAEALIEAVVVCFQCVVLLRALREWREGKRVPDWADACR
jgi:hypothetical protein